MSQALERLRQQAANSPDMRSRLHAMTRLGVELAQLGKSNEARELMGALREGSVGPLSELLAIYVVLIDGLCSYYDGLKTQSIDRLSRAHALARASCDKKLVGESGVWLALAAYSFDKHHILETSLLDAAQCADSMEPSVLARLVAIIADLLQLTGFMADATAWYSRARTLARVEQDDAVLVAIEFNRLAAGLTRLKYDEFLGNSSNALESRKWGVELASVESLHRAYRNESLTHLLTLCNARNRYFSGDIVEAIPLLYGLYRDQRWTDVGLTREALLAECTWCRVLSGLLDVVSPDDFPSIENISGLDSSTKIDCLYYASKIGSRLYSEAELSQINTMLSDSRNALALQIEMSRRLVARVVDVDSMKSLFSSEC